jgi:hypothetical protein
MVFIMILIVIMKSLYDFDDKTSVNNQLAVFLSSLTSLIVYFWRACVLSTEAYLKINLHDTEALSQDFHQRLSMLRKSASLLPHLNYTTLETWVSLHFSSSHLTPTLSLSL